MFPDTHVPRGRLLLHAWGWRKPRLVLPQTALQSPWGTQQPHPACWSPAPFGGRQHLPPLASHVVGLGGLTVLLRRQDEPREWPSQRGLGGRETEELPRGHEAGDNARASYAQPAQRALPAGSAAPSGYAGLPNLMG